jgi:2-alkyl-3-oxoalkanoate reductase
VPMSLTAVDNLAAACLAAAGVAGHPWPPGAYNVADAEPYRRDEIVAAVLGVPVRHLPAGVVRAAAAVAGRARHPVLTRYAIDQLTDGMVLDIGRARAQGWTPDRRIAVR